MKLELPLAILLLAIGGWHWMSYSTSKPDVDSKTPIAQSNSHTLPPRIDSPIQQTVFHQAIADSMPAFNTFEPDADDPGILLAQAAKRLEHSPPLSCQSRCQIQMFGQTIVGEGTYCQQGQGSGLTRLENEVSDFRPFGL